MEQAQALLSVPTSPKDLFRIAGKKCNVFTYPEISKFKSYRDLFKRGNSDFTEDDDGFPFDNTFCIILYLTTERSGHWTCICNRRNSLNFLDSYGEVIDNQLKHVNNEILGQHKKYLIFLLSKIRKPIYYNDLKLQKLSQNIATCGRYCALYLKFDTMGVDDFMAMLKKKAEEYGISTDLLVCIMSINTSPGLGT